MVGFFPYFALHTLIKTQTYTDRQFLKWNLLTCSIEALIGKAQRSVGGRWAFVMGWRSMPLFEGYQNITFLFRHFAQCPNAGDDGLYGFFYRSEQFEAIFHADLYAVIAISYGIVG